MNDKHGEGGLRMADLTLQEALEQYEPECRKLMGDRVYKNHVILCRELPESAAEPEWLIGACVVWLAGQEQINESLDKPTVIPHGKAWKLIHPREPLRFLLNEVRAHTESHNAKN